MTWHTQENFARPRPGLTTIRRADLTVRVVRSHLRPGHDEGAADPAHQPFVPPDPATIAEVQRRFEICKACEHSRDNTFACALHPTCCFGRYRGDLENHCPQAKW